MKSKTQLVGYPVILFIHVRILPFPSHEGDLCDPIFHPAPTCISWNRPRVPWPLSGGLLQLSRQEFDGLYTERRDVNL